jgi:uncharacterized protein
MKHSSDTRKANNLNGDPLSEIFGENYMKTLDEIKQILSERKSWLCETYQITELGIFGSYARGEQTQDSDVDILIDYEQAPTLFKLVNLRDYLKDLTGLSVDIVTKNGLKPGIRDQVLSEVIYLEMIDDE